MTAFVVILIGLALLCAVSWIVNLFKIFTKKEGSGLKIVRLVGIFIVPLGVFAGFF